MEQRNTCGTITGATHGTPRGPEDIVCNTIIEDNVLKSGTKSLEQPDFPKNGKGRFWSITSFVHTREEIMELVKKSRATIISQGWNTEICPETNRQHEQGYVEYKNPVYWSSVQKTFLGAHIERAKKVEALKKYCEKEDTRKPGTKPMKTVRKPLEDPLEGKELYDWELEILEMIKQKPHDRKIYWYYSKHGMAGKTMFAKNVCIRYRDAAIVLSGGAKDIKCGVAKHFERWDLDIAMFIFTRSVEDYVSYEALEAVKDGLFYSPKYESSMVIMNTPHVIVFANFHPTLENKDGKLTLSPDRWVIKNINNDDDDDEEGEGEK